MAQYSDRFDQNAPGSFYVDRECIDCDLCRERIPEVFGRDDDEAHSFVIRQPENGEERERCLEALDDCPADAIGDDGPSGGGPGIPVANLVP